MISVVTDYAPCLAVRRQVFVEEQGISEADEVDGRDPKAIHLLATDQGKPVGAARILISGEIGKIGRICVVSEKRGSGLGRRRCGLSAQARQRHTSKARIAEPCDRLLRWPRLSPNWPDLPRCWYPASGHDPRLVMTPAKCRARAGL